MNHRRKMTVFATILLLEATGCAFNPGASIQKSTPSVEASVAPLVQEGKISLYASEEKDGLYHNIAIDEGQGEQAQHYDWETVSNPGYEPMIHEQDLNGDGQAEIIVITTKGYGTGVYISEAHVIEPKQQTEVAVEDALAYTKAHVSFSVVHKSGKSLVNANVTDQPAVELPLDPTDRNELPQFGNIIDYHVGEDQTLTAEVAAQLADGEAVGTAILHYRWDEGTMKVSQITFEAVAS
ncbi:hypothetical protein PQ456_02325 [Paenibacillus kyungheensis]|uniref:Uncharacterized protein n=1 Tax=Paenibacillus kyungheensis TaxID=1452732 RepID=A0AAX3M2G9_9BACL|nr:hypothetical protein [Paenibacillus kyungheensis]WCT56389.1 hypothetical protein PQ456_02325 [Paenibacillus kyungheensis]